MHPNPLLFLRFSPGSVLTLPPKRTTLSEVNAYAEWAKEEKCHPKIGGPCLS